MTLRRTMLAAAAVALAGGLHAASAADLKIGTSSPASSLDPHWQNLIPNLALSAHMFDTLVRMDADSQIVPSLAQSWKLADDTTWEFKLRPGVTFHDGSPFTADDVVYSLARPATITKSPAPFTIYTRSIKEAKAVDPLTVRITTTAPYPLLANDLAQVFIMSQKAASGVTTEDMNTGKGVVGTGPYKLGSYAPEDRAELVRNDTYFGGKPAWDKVTYRYITSDGPRTAALLSGDVDAIDNVPSADLPRIRGEQSVTFAQKPSLRVIYFYIDSGRDDPPFVTNKDGGPIGKNPFKDARVRKAVSMAINREAIRDRIMEGLSFPSSHIVPPSLRAGESGFELMAYDPDGAKKLMAEAGWPDGFRLTMHSPNNRFPNDSKITQAVAQMLSRIGIQAQVDAMPMSVYATRGAKGDFSFGLIGWGAQTGEVSSTLRAIIACENKDRGWGAFNWSRYCNKEVDDLLAKGLATMDDKQRTTILNQASKIAANDGAVIPIHFQSTTWAAKKGIAIEPRSDERTLAMSFKPAQ
ncbi:ABC transporter substrate-binding protein [Alsobacter sp. R-9]